MGDLSIRQLRYLRGGPLRLGEAYEATVATMGTKIVRVCSTAILAFAVARFVNALLFLALWPVLYLSWSDLGRRRAARGLRTILWNEEKKLTSVPIAKNRYELRRAVRAIGFTFAAILVGGLVFDFILIAVDLQKAKEARARVQEGMTVGEVLHLASNGTFLWANSDAPPTDPDHPRALNLAPGSESGKYSYFDSTLRKDREISHPEVLALLHQRLGDGYRWRLEYFFPGRSIEHFSFKVVFDEDGHVREVTPLHSFE